VNEPCTRRAIAVATLLWIAGCERGPPTGTVSGSVDFAGKRYGDAAVVLMSLKTGGGGTCDLSADGRFELPKPLVVGEYAVYLAPKVAAVAGDAPPAAVTIDKRIPGKYWSESSTDVKVVVKPGPNEFAIELRP
jgi:hypothetical protein